MHSMFNIQEFQAAFSLSYCTLSNWILHGNSAYSVHTVCSCIAQNMRWITVVLSNDIAAILPCTVLYVQPKFSHTLYVQYTRVSSWFSHHDIVLLARLFYMEKGVQCAYRVFLHFIKCALIHGCFIQRYRSDPAMYSTLPVAKMQPDTRFSI